jgi:biopolymer transport protein TolQ
MDQATDYSMWGLFLHATIMVKLIMILLIAASVWCWGIVIDKTVQYRRARREAQVFDRAFWSGEPLDGLFEQIGASPKGQSQRVFAAGMIEWRRSHKEGGGLIAGAQSRIDRAMDVAIAREAESLQKGLGVLATVGSTAPFVGLFGTVWGIMNSFLGIAEQENTSLAVVAPGISEALLATGLGLLAAIPAVIFYNKLSADANRITGGYEAFADEFSTILSRQLDAAA